MKLLHNILLVILLLVLAGCSRGPDNDSLNTEIQQRLDQQFSDQLFKINKLTRKGSAPRLDGNDGIYIYYNIELEFLREYNLTSWRNLNLGTLAVVLGSTTTGIEGFNNRGNKKGQILQVRGRLSFHQDNGIWVANTFTPIQSKNSVAVTQTLDSPSPRNVLKNIRVLIESGTSEQRSERDKITLYQLRRALAHIDLGHAELKQYHTLGTGWSSGAYYQFGEAFTSYANKHGGKLFNYSSEGSLENGYRVNTGLIDFAILQNDVAEVLSQPQF